jgi:hypothetical protein
MAVFFTPGGPTWVAQWWTPRARILADIGRKGAEGFEGLIFSEFEKLS